jgi:tetratricopeptide (TPR) repeat protein
VGIVPATIADNSEAWRVANGEAWQVQRRQTRSDFVLTPHFDPCFDGRNEMDNSDQKPNDDQSQPAKVLTITERLENQKFERFRALAAKSHNREIETAFDFASIQKDLESLDFDEVMAVMNAWDDPRAPDMIPEMRSLHGWQLIMRGQEQQAHAVWDSVANDYPHFAQPHIFRARFMVPTDPAGAIEWYDKAAEREPANRQIYWGKAECYRRLGDMDRSIAHLRRALSLEPNNVDTMTKLGSALTSVGEPTEALKLFDQAIARAPNYADFYLARAVAHYALLHYPEAAADYDRILKLDPTHQAALFFRARCLSKIDGESERALEAIGAFCRNFPDEAIGHLEHGSILLNAMQVPEALEALTRAIELDPNLAAAYGKRGSAHLRMFQIDQCEEDLARAYELDPNDLEHAIVYATVLRAKGRNEDSLTVIDRLLIDNEDFFVLHRERAETLSRMERDEEALAAILRAHELEPANASILAGVASMYFGLEQWANAVDYCDQALALNPEDGATHSLRATCRAWLDFDDPRIAQDYARAVDLAADNWSIHVLRSRYLLEKYQYADALAEAEAAIELAPHIGESHALRARASFHGRQQSHDDLPPDRDFDEEAERAASCIDIADLERALELGFEDDSIYSELAGHLQELREDDRAMEYVDKGLARNPDDCGCLIWRGSIRRRRGDIEGSKADHARVDEICEANRQATVQAAGV